MTKDEIDNALRSWHTINKALKTMSEQDCKVAMERELVGNRRKDIVVRVHQAFSRLRLNRERDELIVAVSDIPAFMVKA